MPNIVGLCFQYHRWNQIHLQEAMGLAIGLNVQVF